MTIYGHNEQLALPPHEQLDGSEVDRFKADESGQFDFEQEVLLIADFFKPIFILGEDGVWRNGYGQIKTWGKEPEQDWLWLAGIEEETFYEKALYREIERMQKYIKKKSQKG